MSENREPPDEVARDDVKRPIRTPFGVFTGPEAARIAVLDVELQRLTQERDELRQRLSLLRDLVVMMVGEK
jgi:hypothetical protein